MRRYFLTGCTGFAGRALVRELALRPDTEEILLLTRNAQSRYDFYGIDSKVKLYEGNINTCPFPTGDFTHIIHGANPPANANSQEVYYAIVDGTARILEWATRRGIPNFLLLSSGAARGDPSTVYGRGKRMAELLLRCQSTTAKIARIYTLIGDGVPPQYALGEFIRQAVQEKSVTCRGGDMVQRSYLHVDDAAKWLLRIMDEGQPLFPYPVGGAMAYTIDEIARFVAHKFEVPYTHIAGPYITDRYLPELRDTLRLGCNTTIPLGTALEMIRDETRLRNSAVQPSAAA